MFAKMKLSRLAIAVALSVGLSAAAMAQETSSGINGKIMTPTGVAAAGTVITVIHVPSGTTRQVTVNNSGSFSLRGLRVGGPYRLVVDSDTFQDTTVNGVFLELGTTFDVDLTLEAASNIEVISVTASAVNTSAFGGTGPASFFDLDDLENAPAINRDINDIIRSDPRIYIDESRNDSVQCGGASPRFNSLTLDGVRLNDGFGLNSNGYPTERMPFSFDSIQQVAVELAPFDVQYGGFTACNINAVTKSGTNEMKGGVFYDYTSDSYRGDTVDGDQQDNGNYTEKRFGGHVGFPLIEDKLFFFGSYQKIEGVQLFDYAALGSRVTADDVAQITEIANRVYNYDVGGTPGSAPVEDENILLKLDWNISDMHRASLVYNWADGFSISQSDGGSSRLSLSNHFYERGAELKYLVGSVYSDWSDNFSTEFRASKMDLDNRQNSLDRSGFAEVQIDTASDGTVYIGPDDSRQSNDLNYDILNLKFAATYFLEDHKITVGVEYENLDVFNLFMQHTVGEYRFGSIAEFEAGTPDRIYYNNSAGTNNPADAGASFSYATTTLYAQDDFPLTDDIDVMVGFRYDSYSSDDTPNYNANFERRYGFDNTGNVDGISLFQPRVGFKYSYADNLEFRGGFGLYSGGNPNVWISNAYSNDGVTNIGTRERDIPDFTNLFDTPLTGEGRPIYDIPQAMFDTVANTTGGDGNVNATDPNFEIPSEWKYAVGATYITPQEYIISADLMYTKRKDSAKVIDALLVETGNTLPDGRPEYASRLTERRFTGSDFILTNSGQDGDTTVFSVSAMKQWDNGIDAQLAYAYTKAEDANPMTSAVGFSNYVNFATSDPINPVVATSDYEIPQRFTFTLGYKTQFVDGYDTRFNLFAVASEGKPYSFVYGNNDAFDYDASSSRQLIYVPEVNDANVVYGPDFDLAGFDAFVDEFNLARGQIVGRNSQNADWWTKIDLRISQQLPGFTDDHKASAFLVIENFTNLLNDSWGDFRQGSFVGDRVVEASLNGSGQYVYESFNTAEQSIARAPSLWEIRVGVKYTF
jgi:outer membrane receptor for ferrienterochelin and colicin